MQSRWGSKQVQVLREVVGDTPRAFAQRVRTLKLTVVRWERGAHAPTQLALVERLDHIAKALTPAQRAEFLSRLTPEQRAEFDELFGEAEASGTDCEVDPPAPDRIDMHRRIALEWLTAVTAAGMTAAVPWNRMAAPKIDEGLVVAYEQASRGMISLYRGGDPHATLPAVAAFADSLALVLRVAPTRDLRLRLAVVAVDAHAMAGVLALHADDPVLQQRHVAVARQVAEDSGDPLLRARAWSLLASTLYSPLTDPRGDSRTTVKWLGRAKALARKADGHTRAFLDVAYAEEAAELKDVKLCHATIDQAQRVLSAATGHDGGFFSPDALFGPVELYLQGVQGRLAGRAGRLDEAEHLLGDELDRAVSDRQRVNVLCILGTVRVENAEPEGACAALAQAFDLARVACPGKVARVAAVRAKMPEPMDGLACVTDLDELLGPAP